MCGINYSKIKCEFKKININKIILQINSHVKNKNFIELLEILKKLRANYIFIIIILDKNKIKNILNNLLYKIEKIKKNNKKNDINEILTDIIWIIESEILFKCNKIKEFIHSNKISLNENSIIFVRYLLYTLESMNYLESRGRDSLGLSINFYSKKKINLKKNFSNDKSISFYKKKIKNFFFSNLTLKYANRIGYSGENTNKILLLLKSINLKKINFNSIKNFEIYSHTRWASVGEVNLSNTHPLIQKDFKNFFLVLMNGDINNFKTLDLKLKRKKILINNNCTNDLKLIPSLLKYNKNIQKTLEGSYVIIAFDLRNFNSVKIYKKGTQGLYLSFDQDKNIHLSSDIYGLVNKSKYFKRLDFDGTLNLNKNQLKKFKKNKFESTDLMTKDLSKKNKENFFVKEINETQAFVNKTIYKYIDFEKKSFKNLNNFFEKKITQNILLGKIKNIIFTGMGSCYTAAVGISKYLENKLIKIGLGNLKTEATIASEGSGFYLTKDMSNCIIIVVAQSGTTIDTNTYAKLAKQRGAFTYAILNKYKGDISFIVDKNIYLGNGRDIEISVPSTKTYTCHLITGSLIVENLIQELTKKKNESFFNQCQSLYNENKFEDNIKNINDQLEKLKINLFNYKNWVVVYDTSINSFQALELRIKLSECCYKSIQVISLNLFNKQNYENFLVFYITSSGKIKIKKNKKNFFIGISNINIKNLNKSNQFNLYIKYKNYLEMIVKYSLAIQLTAYKISKFIDAKSTDENAYKDNKLINFIFDKNKLNIFNKHKINYKKKFLKNQLIRPIDSIKHQAKTITVGAIRSLILENINYNNVDNRNIYLEKEITYNNLISNFNKSILIYSTNKDVITNYYLSNIIEYYNDNYNKNLNYKFTNSLNLFNSFSNKKDITRISISNKNLLILNGKKKEIIKNLNSYNILKNILPNDIISKKNDFIYKNALLEIKNNINQYKINFYRLIKNFNNIKFLGSGINYLIAKKYALIFSRLLNKSIAYDVIENHKHIDISSESLIFVFASNIEKKGFQRDVSSEIEKYVSHENEPIIFTNKNNNIFDNFNYKNNFIDKRIIKFPLVNEIYSLSFFDNFFNNIIIN